MIRAALALALLLCSACLVVGIRTTVQPESTEGPIPRPFEGDEAPALVTTDVDGLFSAPSLGPNVYYDKSSDLWYRRAYRRWYQAFRWNGNWFILNETPQVLEGRAIEHVKLPTLPGQKAEDPNGLPELPEDRSDDEPEGGFEPP